jgi:hypothetical protein
VDNCEADELCSNDDVGASCESNTECECTYSGNWYDADTGLCWQNPPDDTKTDWEAAGVYCNDGTWGGFSDWRLPNIDELISLLRGCQNGTETGDLSRSLCAMTPEGCAESDSCGGINNCSICEDSPPLGPDGNPDGCYWEPALEGVCASYWSSSTSANRSSNAVYVTFGRGYVSDALKTVTSYVRCVRGEP